MTDNNSWYNLLDPSQMLNFPFGLEQASIFWLRGSYHERHRQSMAISQSQQLAGRNMIGDPLHAKKQLDPTLC